MRLVDLEPRFVRYESRIGTWNRVLGDPATWKPGDPTESVTGPQEWTIAAPSLAEAQGIEFLCPLCFQKNGSDVGTHWCSVTFEGRGVKPEQGSHGSNNRPTRWTVSGSDFSNLTLQPSILLEGGCSWHGFITNGDVSIL